MNKFGKIALLVFFLMLIDCMAFIVWVTSSSDPLRDAVAHEGLLIISIFIFGICLIAFIILAMYSIFKDRNK